MTIDVFTIIETSFRYGDENRETKYYYKSKEGRDNDLMLMREDYLERCSEISPYTFDDGGKWSYSLEKGEETLTIKD